METRMNACGGYGTAPMRFAKVDADQVNRVLDRFENIDGFNETSLREIADMANNMKVDPNSKVQGPLKTFVTIAAATGLSVIAGNTVGTRIAKMLNKNPNIMNALGKTIMNVVNKMQKFAMKSGISKNVFGKELRKMFIAIKQYARKGADIVQFGPKATNITNQGKNLINKLLGVGTAAGFGTSTLVNSTKDKNGNGIADSAESVTKGSIAKTIVDAAIECV